MGRAGGRAAVLLLTLALGLGVSCGPAVASDKRHHAKASGSDQQHVRRQAAARVPATHKPDRHRAATPVAPAPSIVQGGVVSSLSSTLSRVVVQSPRAPTSVGVSSLTSFRDITGGGQGRLLVTVAARQQAPASPNSPNSAAQSASISRIGGWIGGPASAAVAAVGVPMAVALGGLLLALMGARGVATMRRPRADGPDLTWD